MPATLENETVQFAETFNRIRDEVAKFIVGQKDIVENVLTAICCGGHAVSCREGRRRDHRARQRDQ